MKKNMILKIVIVIIVFALAIITYFTFFTENETLDNVGFIFTPNKNVEIDSNIDYIEKYKENIISEKTTSYDYEIILDNATLYGKVYIDDEGYLYISDDFKNKSKQINNEKFSTIYRNATYGDTLVIYALSDTKKIYKIILESSNIDDIKFYELKLKNEVTNFTNLNVDTVSCDEVIPIVLCSDNKMYVVDYDLLYNTNYYILYDNYVIFDDNTFALTNGKKITDENGEDEKGAFYITFGEKVYDSDPKIAIVTNSGELLFRYSDNEVYSYNKLIESVNVAETINLNFFDNTYLSFKGNYYNLGNHFEE